MADSALQTTPESVGKRGDGASLDELRQLLRGEAVEVDRGVPTGIDALDRVLPHGTLPSRGVIELASPRGLGGIVTLALQLCRRAQFPREVPLDSAPSGSPLLDSGPLDSTISKSKRLDSEKSVSAPSESTLSKSAPSKSVPSKSAPSKSAPSEPARWCAWVDPQAQLYAPAVRRAGVILERVLVVRPRPEDMTRVAVRLVTSGLFEMVVIDRCSPELDDGKGGDPSRWGLAVRRLNLAAQSRGGQVLLLSELERAQRETLPTTMRLEMTRHERHQWRVRVAKDRRGGITGPHVLPMSALERPLIKGAPVKAKVSDDTKTFLSLVRPA